MLVLMRQQIKLDLSYNPSKVNWLTKLVEVRKYKLHVVGSMDQYHMRCLQIPHKSVKKLKTLQRNYWWN